MLSINTRNTDDFLGELQIGKVSSVRFRFGSGFGSGSGYFSHYNQQMTR